MSIISICVTGTFQGLQEIAFSLAMSLLFDEKWREMHGEKGSMTMIFMNWYRQYGSVYVVWMFFIPVVILSDPDMAKKALITLNLPKEPGLYSKLSSVFGQRAAGQGILTEVDHDAWRLKRAMLEPGFHRKYLMNSMEAFNSICGDFLQNLRKYADGKTPVRMVDEFARVILDIIGKVLTVGIMIIYAFGGLSWLAQFKLRVFDMWCFFVH